jgi:hypothetical protein
MAVPPELKKQWNACRADDKSNGTGEAVEQYRQGR